MKNILFAFVLLPSFLFGETISELEMLKIKINQEIIMLKKDINVLNEALEQIENDLHFARYKELCNHKD